ncbi:hydrophobe/amphiphile efflux-3 (HAE3) family transporter [Bacillus smithii]|uniref:hydrophobe/amphiphile efflux-3 (HAE3) family transporter n=1 Tax=Bacillus smithii TaxID=1479 RepID=UPI003D192490
MKQVFETIGDFISRHARMNIMIFLALTVLFALGLPKIQMQMGNEVFISKSSSVYKNTKIYQNHFGGDPIFILLSGDKNQLISHQTAQEIDQFMQKANKIDNITGGTNFVNVLNSELRSKNASMGSSEFSGNSELQKTIWNSLTDDQKQKIQTSLQNSLTNSQKKQVQSYLESLLTTEQKTKMAEMARKNAVSGTKMTAQQQQAELQHLLTEEQKNKEQQYMMSLLNHEQQTKLQKQIIGYLPEVQNMSDKLLRQILFSDHGKVPSQLENLLPKNGEHVLLILNTSRNTDMNTYVKLNADIHKLVKNSDFGDGVSVKIAGTPAILGQIKTTVMTTMELMLALAVVVMMIVLFVVFPVRRRLLALGFVLIGLIWTFGLMGWLGIPITLATMATLPIIIGLGTDFGVQFHNRYEEEYSKEANVHLAITRAISNMGPAVGIAVLIMALSFLTMFLSKAPMMQQFGLTLAIGVVCCYLVDLVMMFSTFRLLDRNEKEMKKSKKNESLLSRFLGQYTSWVGKVSIPVLAAAVILAGLSYSTESSIPTETNIQKLIPQSLPALKNTNYLQNVVGSTTYVTYLVKAEDVTKPEVVKWMDEFGKKENKKYQDVEGVTSLATTLRTINNGELPVEKNDLKNKVKEMPELIKTNLISKNHQYATIQFKINEDLSTDEQLKLMNKITKDVNTPEGVTANPAGAQVMMLEGINNIGSNHGIMISAGLAVIFVGLLLVYRRVKHAVYPLIPIVLVLGFSPGTLKLLDISYNPLTTALSSLVLGIGTEFTILIMERYREEEAKGYSAGEAIKVAVSKVGQAITASGLTVIGGFSVLIFANFPVLKTFGITTVIDTAYSLISALTILPSLIMLFRRREYKKQAGFIQENS